MNDLKIYVIYNESDKIKNDHATDLITNDMILLSKTVDIRKVPTTKSRKNRLVYIYVIFVTWLPIQLLISFRLLRQHI